MFRTFIIYILITAVLYSQIFENRLFAEDVILPSVGHSVSLSESVKPLLLKAMKVDSQNPFIFEFIFDQGSRIMDHNELKVETMKLIKYFLTSLTMPAKDLWVNLSPYEQDSVIEDEFSKTDMGRDLLAEDYILKQVSASLLHPQGKIGREFWEKIYFMGKSKYESLKVPINAFNKVWIVPNKARVLENKKLDHETANIAFIKDASFTVMLEEDYLAKQKNEGSIKDPSSTTRFMRELVIPELTREVNEGKNFTQLKQIFYSLILATWYKEKFQKTVVHRLYADQRHTKGIEFQSGKDKETIYARYQESFKKGVFNFINEEKDPSTQQIIPKKYFSGGIVLQKTFLDGKSSYGPINHRDLDEFEDKAVIARVSIKPKINKKRVGMPILSKREMSPDDLKIGMAFKAINPAYKDGYISEIVDISFREADLATGVIKNGIVRHVTLVAPGNYKRRMPINKFLKNYTYVGLKKNPTKKWVPIPGSLGEEVLRVIMRSILRFDYVANAMGITSSRLSNYIYGRNHMSLELLERFLKISDLKWDKKSEEVTKLRGLWYAERISFLKKASPEPPKGTRGNRIWHARISKGLSYTQIVKIFKKAGFKITRASLHQYEQLSSTPNDPRVFEAYQSILGLSSSDLATKDVAMISDDLLGREEIGLNIGDKYKKKNNVFSRRLPQEGEIRGFPVKTEEFVDLSNGRVNRHQVITVKLLVAERNYRFIPLREFIEMYKLDRPKESRRVKKKDKWNLVPGSLGEALYFMIKDARISYSTVARNIYVSNVSLSNYIYSKQLFSYETLQKILKYDDLFISSSTKTDVELKLEKSEKERLLKNLWLNERSKQLRKLSGMPKKGTPGYRLWMARTGKGWTMEELIDQLKKYTKGNQVLTKMTISNYEQNIRKPQNKRIISTLESVLELDIGYLYGQDRSLVAKQKGGIDLTAEELISESNAPKEFKNKSYLKEQLTQVQGFSPVLISIEPLVDPKVYFGLDMQKN